MIGFTVIQAAKVLDISEYDVKKLIRDHVLEVIGTGYGQGTPRLISREDVYTFRRKMIMKHAEKCIAVIGTSDDLDEALYVSGLKVNPATDVLDAVSLHPPGLRPILVIGDEAVSDHAGQLRAFNGEISIVRIEAGTPLKRCCMLVWDEVLLRSSIDE